MSVMVLSNQEYNRVLNTLLFYCTRAPISYKIRQAVRHHPAYIDYKYPIMTPEEAQDEDKTISKTLRVWIENIAIANHIAFSVQYNEPLNIEQDIDIAFIGNENNLYSTTIRLMSKTEMKDSLSLMSYNIYTNAGYYRRWINTEDEQLLERIYQIIKNDDHYYGC